MSVRIHLQQPQNYVYTNLDTISGKVSLFLPRDESFSQITVKLECESRTRLAAPRQGSRNERYETRLEVHKLLYKTEVVFPSGQLQSMAAGPKASFTLPYGQHEWPFAFRIPFNNACAPVNSIMDRMQMAQDANVKHIKRTLPPSLSGYPGMCEIRYYVKVTCQRTSLLKENFRAESSFMFFPIEPVRSPANKRESFARKNHQFAPPRMPIQSPQGGFFKKQPQMASPSGPPPLVSIDGRLPDPAIVTCNEPVPLRVLVKKLNQTNEIIFLSTLQIMLIAYTSIRAHELSRREENSWVIMSKANLHVPLTSSGTGQSDEMEIDKTFWNQIPLPNAVCPTFETCNVARRYELKISVGLRWGSLNDVKPELAVEELFMPCKVYSGIEPPAALVEEMFKRQMGQKNDMPYERPTPNVSQQEPRPDPEFGVPVPAYSPPAPGAMVSGAPQGEPDDAPPPSYEDAMAQDIGPVDGPRRNYEQPQTAPITGDEKRSSLFSS